MVVRTLYVTERISQDFRSGGALTALINMPIAQPTHGISFTN